MALPPPRAQTPGGSGLGVVDYRSDSLTSDPAGASGEVTLAFEPVPPGQLWLLERVTVLSTSVSSTRAMVYVGAAAAQNFVDGTERGNIDTADMASPVLVESNTPLTVEWTGADPGSVCTVRIQYQIVVRG